jgi:hypothetical protein
MSDDAAGMKGFFSSTSSMSETDVPSPAGMLLLPKL